MEAIKLEGSINTIKRRRPIEKNNLRYNEIVICTDADTDGYSICAQLINFFYKYWPELVKHNKLLICETPLLQAKKGKEKLDFYSKEEYNAWAAKNNLKSWKISYKKGLAALDDESYKKILHDPEISVVNEDYLAEQSLTEWFHKHKDYRDLRKDKIK